MLPTPAGGRVPGVTSQPDEFVVTVGDDNATPKPSDEESAQLAADRAIIDEAVKRFTLSDEAESVLRASMREDKRFIYGEHWPSGIKAERDEDGRPCLTINKIPQYINQITNQQRMSRPAIQVGPVDSHADIETARILQGVIRHIETDSRAEIAYDHACQDQVGIGRGWFKIEAEFAAPADNSPASWVQDLKIRRVRNPLTIYRDPAAQEPDYSDGMFLLEVVDISRDTFASIYGEDVAKGLASFSMGSAMPVGWLTKDMVRVCKYWRVVQTSERVFLMPDHKVIPESAARQLAAQTAPGMPFEQLMKGRFTKERKVTRRSVEWYLLTSANIIERGAWKGPWIPYIPVLGTELDVDGVVDLRGITRDARDPQRRFDYLVTAEAESIGLAPKAPFIGYKGQFVDPKWKDANRRNYPYLESALLDINGERVPLPQRNVYEPPIRAIAEGIRQADSDLRVTTGYYDQQPNESVGSERSGRAILARQRQGEVGNSHFIDNLGRSITFLGKQLIGLIPFYYDSFRVLRIIGDDNKPEPVGIYAGSQNKPGPDTPIPEGVDRIKDLSVGTYDVTIKMGKSYQTAREEKQDALTALAQAAPPMVPQFADVWIGSYDWDGAQEIAQRLRPPNVAGPEGERVPPAAQQKMMMLMDQNKQLIATLDEKQNTLDTKQLEIDSKERIAKWQLDTQLRIAELQAGTTSALADMKTGIDRLSLALDADALHVERVRNAHEAAAATADRLTNGAGVGPSAAPTPMPPPPAPEPVGAPGVPLGA